MRPSYLFASLMGLVLLPLQHLQRDSTDGGVVQVRLPSQDVTLYYVERKGGMTIDSSVRSSAGRRSDCEVAHEFICQELFIRTTSARQLLQDHSSDGGKGGLA